MAKLNIEKIKERVEALEALRVQNNETEISVVGYQNYNK